MRKHARASYRKLPCALVSIFNSSDAMNGRSSKRAPSDASRFFPRRRILVADSARHVVRFSGGCFSFPLQGAFRQASSNQLCEKFSKRAYLHLSSSRPQPCLLTDRCEALLLRALACFTSSGGGSSSSGSPKIC